MGDHLHAFAYKVGRSLEGVPQGVPQGANQTAVQKAARLFQSCVAVVTKEDSQLGEIRPLLEQIGVNWPNPRKNPDVLGTMLQLDSQLSLQVLLKIQASSTYNAGSTYDKHSTTVARITENNATHQFMFCRIPVARTTSLRARCKIRQLRTLA